MATIHDRLVAALTRKGERTVASLSKKYTVMTRAKGGFYYIGKAGALRIGKNVSTSMSNQRTKEILLDDGDAVGRMMGRNV